MHEIPAALEALKNDDFFQPLYAEISKRRTFNQLDIMLEAYHFAKKVHTGQLRKSGEPFIIHPVAAAVNLAHIGMPLDTVAAGLLHDVLEDTDTKREVLVEKFGESITNIVDGVTKIDKVKLGENSQAETIRKMVVAMSNDIRVLIVKLADRLHNARTWEFVPLDRAQYKAKETLEIYAPLADRLGLNSIKLELEDLSFRTLEPQVYHELENLMVKQAPESESYVENFLTLLRAELHKVKIRASVSGRPKHIYSIYKKMVTKHYEFKDIYDLVAVRIIVDTVRDCYGALGAIHAAWGPMHGRFKDYIAMPKTNGYQSLHTTVIGPEGKPIEVQIRTRQMHRHAEFGVAAHWMYKERNPKKGSLLLDEVNVEKNLVWMKQLTDWKEDAEDSSEFLDQLRYDLADEEVYVFTPAGKVIALPRGSTPIDFAYTVHTEVGHRAMGAKIDSKLVPLNTPLQNGNTVEIITSKAQDAHPTREWLDFVKSPRARNKIRQFFMKERKEESIDFGKEKLAKIIHAQRLPAKQFLTQEILLEATTSFNLQDIESLYYAVGEGQISAERVLNKIMEITGEDEIEDVITSQLPVLPKAATTPTTDNPGIIIKGVDEVWVKIAKCCTPVPGDQIIGYVTKGFGVTVHRVNCPNLQRVLNEKNRIVEAVWSDQVRTSFLMQIQINALDRANLLTEILKVLSDDRVSINSLNSSVSKDQIATFRMVLDMADPKQLPAVSNHLRQLDNIFEVYRV
ncbi:MAG: bifunctional (p)ppGpp synthetase/guanosine-3',5'-bis(diphosphate) 3'-pyrophosphohydrolase [Bifidobacteriaceae bacterium]|jgi:GTP pyrophosphokinase|nr:bifunctional (p)ppGpp synthetase/guanosine-3',5'-bis(diphosphate) 3'-pyrophosphohydrolase [Bifidobacteriaceae bacterium]